MKIYKNRCKICGGPFESKREGAQYCGDKCKKRAQRVPNVVPDNVPDNQERLDLTEEELLYDLETKSLKELDEQKYWVPNWKRAGYASREESHVQLMKIFDLVPGLYQFKGFNIETK